MTIEPLPLLELFTRLRDAGLPLGTDEYQLILKALQGGFGLDDRAALQQLCETLWIKNNEEKQLLVHHFNQLFPLEFESSGIPSTTLRSQKQIWKNPSFYLLATILCGTSILGTRLVMPEAESLTGIEVIGAPLDNQINGNAPVEPIDNNLPQEAPETVTQQGLPRWIWWMIICSVTVPSALLITWGLFQIFLEQNSPTQKKESSDTFSRAPQTIEDEIEAVELDFLKEDILKIHESMKVGTQRIRDIVLSLRNFSRLDEADFKQVDIHQGIDSTLLILQNRLKQKAEEIIIIKEYKKLTLVKCYPSQLNQAMMNIISNAIDSLETNINNKNQTLNPEIRITTEQSDNNHVTIRIADNGCGMTEEVHSKLFDPFFTPKPVGEGTGLGLSIAYKIIVNKHKGKLSCNSELGKGAEFIIEIPVNS